MQDQETGSLWSHIRGEAMQGRLKGKKLQQLPSIMTDWNSWSTKNPDSTVVYMSRTSRSYVREFYARPERFVLGIVADGKAHGWGFDFLIKNPAVNDKLGNKPVLVTFDRPSVTARLFDRKLGDQVLTFSFGKNQLVDRETSSSWDPVTGRALAGPLAGKDLVPLPAIVSYRAVWEKFHPDSKISSTK